jgi:hypothetical protein
MSAIPRSFTEVTGWRDAFKDAARRLDEIRTGSLFDLPHDLLGESVRSLSFADWTLLEQADNPLVVGGQVSVAHASNLVWLLSPHFRRNCLRARISRRILLWRIVLRYRFNELEIVSQAKAFVDDSFVDMPGYFATGSGGTSPTEWPRKTTQVDLCAEIMAQFPSFKFDELRTMPLALFWQWLHAARSKKYPEYRNYQLTDAVNTAAMSELNRIKRELASRN